VMAMNVGVIRDKTGLARALGAIPRYGLKQRPANADMLTTALLIASAAYARREAGARIFRSDFPKPKLSWRIARA